MPLFPHRKIKIGHIQRCEDPQHKRDQRSNECQPAPPAAGIADNGGRHPCPLREIECPRLAEVAELSSAMTPTLMQRSEAPKLSLRFSRS